MIAHLSPRDRRTLAAGALILGALILLGRGVPAWRRWESDAVASAQAAVDADARAARIGALLPAMLDSLDARRRRLGRLEQAMLQGGDPAGSSADLASRVSAIAEAAGVELGAVQVQPDSASGDVYRVAAVRFEGTGDVPGVVRLLHLLETGPELLVIREAALHQPNPGGPPEQPEAIRVEIEVQALAPAGRDTLSRAAP